jgi:hypothetical protein
LKRGEGADPAPPKLKPAKPGKPAEGCPGDDRAGEIVGVRVRLGEDRGDRVVGIDVDVDVDVLLMLMLLLRVRGEGEFVSPLLLPLQVGGSEKSVRSFWRERAGERRVEGIVCWRGVQW